MESSGEVILYIGSLANYMTIKKQMLPWLQACDFLVGGGYDLSHSFHSTIPVQYHLRNYVIHFSIEPMLYYIKGLYYQN